MGVVGLVLDTLLSVLPVVAALWVDGRDLWGVTKAAPEEPEAELAAMAASLVGESFGIVASDDGSPRGD